MHSTQSNPKLKPNFAFEAIGTHWAIETPTPLTEPIKRAVAERIEAFDQTYSRFRKDSLVTRINGGTGTFEFPADARRLIDFYRDLYEVTDGAVTPLIGQALVESGYDADYSFKAGKVSRVEEWDDVMEWRGNMVTTKQPILLDFGAAGKGYLVDIIGELLEGEGVHEYVIDASGDIRHRGSGMERIGLEDPHDAGRVIGVMNMRNASLCASATNRRQWGGGMHHVIDPSSTSPARSVAATWARAETTMVADGLATALFFTKGERLREEWNFQYVRLEEDGKLSHSHEFMGELFI